MTKIRRLADMEHDSIGLREELTAKLRQIMSYADDPKVEIPQDDVEEPTYVYFSDNDNEAYEGRVEAVTLHPDGDISISVGGSCPDTELYLSEYLYCFRSHTWLTGICNNLIEVLEIDLQQCPV